MYLFKRICLLALLTALTLACPPVQAQSGGRILLQSPDFSKFPKVSLSFEAYNRSGRFLSDLVPGETQVTENDVPVTVDSLVRLQPGLHIILAFNAAQPMAAVGGAQSSRFDLVKNVLLDWIRAQSSDVPDELSLVTNTGPQATRLTSPVLWANALQAYTPDLSKAQASLGSLITALDLAGDPTRRVTSKRAILYVTGPLPDANLTALPNLADRAVQLGVRISTWLVLPAQGETRSGKALAELAAKTGGEFFTFAGTERLPDPELNFQSLRYVYRLSYTSPVRQSGTQLIRFSIKRDDFSAPVDQRYTLNLQVPNPFFLSPPTLIERTWSQPEAPVKPVLLPAEVELQAIVEYPDGLRRALRASRLFVDGKLVYEITADPFNPLVWSLTDIRSSGKHTLQVVVEDIFGLTHTSIGIPVDVRVEPAPALSLEMLIVEAEPYLPYAGAAGVGLALIGAVVVLRRILARRARRMAPASGPTPPEWEGSRIGDDRPDFSSSGVVNWLKRLGSGARSASKDSRGARPVLSTRLRPIVPIPAKPRPFTSPDAPARLARIAAGEAQLTGDFIALSQEVIRLGSDPHQADYVFDSEAVDGLHAQIMRTAGGQYVIRDAGSITGTWVNYVQSAPDGTLMEHGDLIQIGREVYRFELMDPPPARSPRVVPYREEA